MVRASRSARRLLSIALASLLVAVGLVSITPATPAAAADFSVQRWRTVEIPLTSTTSYADPFANVDVTATFVGPGGATISRPAFWNGGSGWVVRFAPTQVGAWTMTTSATNASDAGLHGVTRTIDATAYNGSLGIYQHGFLTPSADGKYLQHADGTPFFYLGDTHWIMPHERWGTSNAPGIASQFKYAVDKRVAQGFTVYQSQPIWQPHVDQVAHTPQPGEESVADLRNGMTSADLPGFAALDRKFQYIADAGLVHTNAMIDWVTHLNDPAYASVYTTAYIQDLARYWDARYGSYPVIWTVAQEIDNPQLTASYVAPWVTAIQTLDVVDAYDHPLMPHMGAHILVSSANSRFDDEPWHDGYATQLQFGNYAIPTSTAWNVGMMQQYWATSKPTILLEAAYDSFWTDSRTALGMLYRSYLSGVRGYGYGASGVWNDVYSAPGQPIDSGTSYELNQPERYMWWYDGVNLPTGGQLTHGANLFRSLNWWRLTPRFGDAAWSDVGAGGDKFVASDSNDTYVAFFGDLTTTSATLRQLDNARYYSAAWFNPRTGETTTIDSAIEPVGGAWTAPSKPSADDWVLLLQKGAANNSARKPVVTEVGDQTSPHRVVTLTSATAGATIRYTTDGSAPTSTSTVYTAPLSLADAATVTLRAIATAPGLSASPVTTATFTQNLVDLATGGTYSASSQWNASQAAQFAFDKSSSTNWQACNLCWSGQWLQVDFGVVRAFDTVVLTEYASRTQSYKIQYWNGSVWVDAYAGTSGIGAVGVGSVLRFSEVAASRVRILYASGMENAPIVYDFGVYNDPDLTVAATATSSSTWNSAQGPAKAIDGNPDTNWQACSGCWGGQWLQVDFGTSRTFDTVTVSEYDNRTTGYKIEYWTGSAWATAYTGSGGFGTQYGSTTVTFPEITSSRILLSYTSGNGAAPIVYEFSVFNDPDYTLRIPRYDASSQYDGNQTAAKAFDGSAATNWQACFQCWSGQWLEADFQRPRTFSRVEISEYDNRTTAYRIEYWNGSGWSTAYTGTGGFGATGSTKTITFPAVTATSVRLFFVSGNGVAPIIYEFSVYGS